VGRRHPLAGVLSKQQRKEECAPTVVDVRRVASVLSLLLVVVGCSSQADRPSDLDSLMAALRGRGFAVGQVTDSGLALPVDSPLVSSDGGMAGFTVTIDGNDLQVIQFDTPAEAASFVISLGPVSADMPIEHMWSSGRIIILFDGSNQNLTDALSDILGTPTVAPLWAPTIGDR